MAGCAPAAPSPSVETAVPSPVATRSPAATAPPVATPSPTASGLLAEIEIQALDPEVTDTILEFASDGLAVIFSSGLAEDAGRDAAPDLWRLQADAPEPTPELAWRNPNRDHSIVKLAGDGGAALFVDIPLDGSRAWDLWLIPGLGDEAIRLDTHPGDEEVSSLVPSFDIQERTVVWTAFDIGPSGPVSQLLWAHAPDWEPMLLLERPAAEAELWLPSLDGDHVAYSEIRYSEDRTSDTRSVNLLEVGVPGAQPERLDHSDQATMPILVADTVIWKEADPGFNMFNWGRLWRHEIGGPGPRRLSTAPQEYVNYPSAGFRFVAWWGAEANDFGVYDLLEDRPRLIESHSFGSGAEALRPHISGDLLVWLYVKGEGPGSDAELRWAFLPPVRSPR